MSETIKSTQLNTPYRVQFADCTESTLFVSAKQKDGGRIKTVTLTNHEGASALTVAYSMIRRGGGRGISITAEPLSTPVFRIIPGGTNSRMGDR